MARVETHIKWLWLARGAEVSLNLSPTGNSLIIQDDFEKSIGLGGRVPLKIPLISISVRPGSSPSVEALLADQFVRLLERSRSVRIRTPNLYGVLKSKGIRGGVSNGASGSPLVDAAEVGFVCLSQPLLDITGLTVLSPGRIGDLKLPTYIVEDNKQPEPTEETPRVSRYERKWVI